MVKNLTSYSSVDTETKLCDLCYKNYNKDLQRFDSHLQSTEHFYKNGQLQDNNSEKYRDNSLYEASNLSVQNNSNHNSDPQIFDEDNSESNSEANKTYNTHSQQYYDNNLKSFSQEQHKDRKSDARSDQEFERNLGRTGTENQSGSGFRPDSRKLSTKGTSIKVKKRFKRPQNSPLPITYDDFYSYFASNGKADLPIFRKRISRHDVKTRDQEAFENYTSASQSISSNMFYFLCGSTISAFDVLGIPWKPQSKANIRTKSVKSSVYELAKNTNSGFPNFGRKNDPAIIKSTIHWVSNFLNKPTFYRLRNGFLKQTENISKHEFSDLSMMPVYIMHRFQISPISKLSKVFDVKIRPVWCVPYVIVSLENLFFGPMIDLVKTKSLSQNQPVFPMALNNRQLGDRVAKPMHRYMRRKLSAKARSCDFSRFDQNIESYFTSIIFTLWGSNLEFSERKFKAYEMLRMYTCFTPFVYEDKIYLTRKGVCSGSYTTNIRDTIVNLALIISALRIKYKNHSIADAILNDYMFKLSNSMYNFRKEIRSGLHKVVLNGVAVYGDDGLIVEEDDFFLIFKFLCSEFNLKITFDEPVKPGESFFFLGRFWGEDGRPWQTRSYMMAHIMFRTKWYKKEDVQFNISEHLDLYRILSICLPLKNGQEFLHDMFHEWDKFQDFLEGAKGYYLLKEWPNEDYVYIPRDMAFDQDSY